ncbi:MAG: FkbM family methyltransferase [Patescibacteria group bacterium]|nr:FkbM family methyltransferase [Patescibacteria group bacterium]MDE1944202.1 FkbM family methyltransferase [Patescibacteria group bacterium]MDE2057893.1 FkbM family methyltransferase [Patescibacteria group bacterium]
MTKRADLEAALAGERLAARAARARRFEAVEGGGAGNWLRRALTAPGIYLPYVLSAKLGLARLYASPVKLFWGRRVRIPLADYDVLILSMYGGLYGSETPFTRFLIRTLGPGDVFYDIGANLGFYTYLALELAREVHAFEPVPSLAATIAANARLGESLTVNAAALSDASGTATFYTGRSTMVGTLDSAVAERLREAGKSAGAITVPLLTLDEYVATHTPPTVLKIDAEGAEGRIIDGGRTLLSAHAPTIAMEVWGKGNQWELSMHAVEKLRALGYRSYRLDEAGEPQPVAGDLSALLVPGGGENFLFKKS